MSLPQKIPEKQKRAEHVVQPFSHSRGGDFYLHRLIRLSIILQISTRNPRDYFLSLRSIVTWAEVDEYGHLLYLIGRNVLINLTNLHCTDQKSQSFQK